MAGGGRPVRYSRIPAVLDVDPSFKHGRFSPLCRFIGELHIHMKIFGRDHSFKSHVLHHHLVARIKDLLLEFLHVVIV